jgi:hypothetical protein
MVWEISTKRTLQQIHKYNAASDKWYARNKEQQNYIKNQIEQAKEKVDALKNKLYDKEHEGLDHRAHPIQLTSKYPEEQALLEQVEAHATIVQHEPKFEIETVYLINGHWFEIHSSFGPFRDDKGEIIDKNDIDWDTPILRKKEYEVKRK